VTLRQAQGVGARSSDSAAERSSLPVRYPDVESPRVMGRRAWWLLGLGFLVPGSAQVLAGSRRLGRFGLAMTIAFWILLVVGIVLALTVGATEVLAWVATHTIVLVALQVLVVVYAALWIVLTLDTLRLTRLVRLGPAARSGVAAVSVVLLVLFGGGAAFAVSTISSVDRGLGVFGAGPAEPPIDGYYNILLIGADSGEDREGLRPDSTTVLSIEASTGQAVMYGLPRDLGYVPFAAREAPADEPSPVVDTMYELYPDGYDGHLNSIYTEVEVDHPDFYPGSAPASSPGIEGMIDAASGALGIPIQYYVLIDMQGFASIIDALPGGGITINVREALPVGGEWVDGENVVPADYWLEPGVQVLNGYNALWYARSRYTTSDYDRMGRQHEVLEQLLYQVEDPMTLLTHFGEIAEAGAQAVKTDIPRSMFPTLVDLARKARDQDIERIDMTPPTIDPEQPDFAYMQQLVRDSRVQPTSEPEA